MGGRHGPRALRGKARLHELMAREGIKTLTELAERVGVDRSTLSKLASGTNQPSTGVMDAVCDAFGGVYDRDWIFPREPVGKAS